MKVFNYLRDATKYVTETNLSDSDKIAKIDDLIHNDICKVDGVIVIVDQFNLLD